MAAISKLNQIVHYSGAFNFSLSGLSAELKGKIRRIFRVNSSGQAFESWTPTGISTFGSLVPGVTYVVESKLPFFPYDLSIDAIPEKDQDDNVDRANFFVTYQGCSNFALSGLSSDTKSKIRRIFRVNSDGSAFESWTPTGISTFGSFVPGTTYIVESKNPSSFSAYSLGLPQKCSNSSSSSSVQNSSSSSPISSSSSSPSQTFTFQNLGFTYTVTGYQGDFPTLTVVRGGTYTFNFESVTSGHPIALRLSSGNTSPVPGTTGNDPVNGVFGAGAIVTYTVPIDAPPSIVYQCRFHSSMIGTISIIDFTSNSSSSSSSILSSSSSGSSGSSSSSSSSSGIFLETFFSQGSGGWSPDFADLPPEGLTDPNYDLDSGLEPVPIPGSGSGFMLQGHNRSDDLFMFIKKQVGQEVGLIPNQTYILNFSIRFASNAPAGAVGIGGPPGEAVTIKAGGSHIEPSAFVDGDGWLRLNLDKGNQSVGGSDLSVAGDFSNGSSEHIYRSVLRSVTHDSVRSDDQGRIWLIVGTDSGFEGETKIYYERILVQFTPKNASSSSSSSVVSSSSSAAGSSSSSSANSSSSESTSSSSATGSSSSSFDPLQGSSSSFVAALCASDECAPKASITANQTDVFSDGSANFEIQFLSNENCYGNIKAKIKYASGGSSSESEWIELIDEYEYEKNTNYLYGYQIIPNNWTGSPETLKVASISGGLRWFANKGTTGIANSYGCYDMMGNAPEMTEEYMLGQTELDVGFHGTPDIGPYFFRSPHPTPVLLADIGSMKWVEHMILAVKQGPEIVALDPPGFGEPLDTYGATNILGCSGLRIATTHLPAGDQPGASLPGGCFVVIGDENNAPHQFFGVGQNPATFSVGSVPYRYAIQKFEFTYGQVLDFLNACFKTDNIGAYENVWPGTDNKVFIQGVPPPIARTGANGSYQYAPPSDIGDQLMWSEGFDTSILNQPATISILTAMRICNWLHNKASNPASIETETGAYDLSTISDPASTISDPASFTTFTTDADGRRQPVITRSPGALYFIPNNDEWVKAAYYKGGGLNAGYWNYANATDAPTDIKCNTDWEDLFEDGSPWNRSLKCLGLDLNALRFNCNENCEVCTDSKTVNVQLTDCVDEGFQGEVCFRAFATDDCESNEVCIPLYIAPKPPPEVKFRTTSVVRTEGDSGTMNFNFDVVRSGFVSGRSTVVDWRVVPSSSQNPANSEDFFWPVLGEFPKGTITFAPGDTSKTITVQVAGDIVPENSEDFLVELLCSGGEPLSGSFCFLEGSACGEESPGKLVGPAQATAFITTDEPELNFEYDLAQFEPTLGSSSFVFSVRRSGFLNKITTVNWEVVACGGSSSSEACVSPEDFVWPTPGQFPEGTLNFAAGDVTKTITVQVADDLVEESAESFTVRIFNPSAATIGNRGTAKGLIKDDDSPNLNNFISMSSSVPVSIAEGDSGTFEVRRIGKPSTLLAVSSAEWRVEGSGSNPASPEDFEGGSYPSGTVTFESGETSKQIAIQVAEDSTLEPAENFVVILSDPINASLSDPASRTGVVRAQTSVRFAEAAVSQSEGDPPEARTFEFNVIRDGDAASSVSVDWEVVASQTNPADPSDFPGGFPSGTLVFDQGEVSKSIVVKTENNTDPQPSREFLVRILSASGASIVQPDESKGVIVDDDYPRVSMFGPSLVAIEEGGSGRFSVYRWGRPETLALTSEVDWTVSGTSSSPASPEDFGGSYPSGTIIFGANETSKEIIVSISGDNVSESNERFSVTLSNPSNAILSQPASATGVIASNAEFTLSFTLTQQKEGDEPGSCVFNFVVNRLYRFNLTSTVDWDVTGSSDGPGDPATPSDFALGSFPSGRLTFAPGDTFKTISVTIASNAIQQNNRVFLLRLLSAQNANLTEFNTLQAMAVIIDDDNPVTSNGIYIDTYEEIKIREGQSGNFPVVRRGKPGTLAVTSTVQWATSPRPTVPASGNDFAGGSFPFGTITFGPGETSKNITINVAEDSSAESNESFYVYLFNPTNSFLTIPNWGFGMIVSESVISFTSGQFSCSEGNSSGSCVFQIPVERSGITSLESRVDWEVISSSVLPSEFSEGSYPSGRLTFGANQTIKYISITVNGNTSPQSDREFEVRLKDPQNASIGSAGSATCKIIDDDQVPDFFVIDYFFTDGKDLDTRTGILDPANSTYIGWAQNMQLPTSGSKWLEWASDNAGSGGVESVVFDKVAFSKAYPSRSSVSIDLRAMWFGSVGKNPVTVTVKRYTGGQMVKSESSWTNPTASSTNTSFPSFSKSVNMYSQQKSNKGERIAIMDLNYVNGTVSFRQN